MDIWEGLLEAVYFYIFYTESDKAMVDPGIPKPRGGGRTRRPRCGKSLGSGNCFDAVSESRK